MLSAEPGAKSTEVGIKFGLAWYPAREALTSIFIGRHRCRRKKSGSYLPSVSKAIALGILGLVPHTTLLGQFDVGLTAGAYAYALHIDVSNGYVDETPSLPLAASLFYRSRSKGAGSFFMEMSAGRKEFDLLLDQGGLGGGVETNLAVRLDQLYFTLGPEFGKDPVTFRIGIQFGWILGGSMEGSSRSWSMYSPPQGYWGSDTIPTQRPDLFKGDTRLLFAFRYNHKVGDRGSLVLDPLMSLPLGSMLKDENIKLRSADLGLRVGYAFRFNGRGVFSDLRERARSRADQPTP